MPEEPAPTPPPAARARGRASTSTRASGASGGEKRPAARKVAESKLAASKLSKQEGAATNEGGAANEVIIVGPAKERPAKKADGLGAAESTSEPPSSPPKARTGKGAAMAVKTPLKAGAATAKGDDPSASSASAASPVAKALASASTGVQHAAKRNKDAMRRFLEGPRK